MSTAMVEKACIVCGNVFNATANHKACSEECRAALRPMRRKLNANGRMIVECVICGSAFECAANGLQITCSKACRYKRSRQRKGKPWSVVRSCVVCGKDIVNPWGTTKTCSEDCRKQNERKWKRSCSNTEAYRIWLSKPENKEKVRQSKRRYEERNRDNPERRAYRRRYDAMRRERRKQADLLSYRNECTKRTSSSHRKRISKMTDEQLMEYRKQKAAKMREWVRKNPDKYIANKRRGRQRKALASALLAAKELLEIEEKERISGNQ